MPSIRRVYILMTHEARKVSLEDFMSMEESKEVEALIGNFDGGSFMWCHTAVFAQTGVWVEELVPVFQKLDAKLAVNNERIISKLVG